MRSRILTGPRIGLFLLISLAVTGLNALFVRDGREAAVLFGIHLVTLFNIYLIVFIVEKILSDAKNNNNKGMLAGVFVVKTTILLLSFIVGVHFVGDRIILSVINYTVQVFLLSIFFVCLFEQGE